jgi:MYXO-CTERM domain-containing protein
LLWFVAVAPATDEPCGGHFSELRVSSDHFWVEWQEGVVSEADAADILEWAEHARQIYIDDLGFPFTDQPIIIRVQTDGLMEYSVSGLTRTTSCEGIGYVPTIDLTIGTYDVTDTRSVTSHEVAHAAQYAYMGDYYDSVTSWLWWMEGCATWATSYAIDDWSTWAYESGGYLEHPELGLHHGLVGFLDADVSDHMYGTAWLANYLEASTGGPDAVRSTWAWGAPASGELLFFPDAIAGIGLDFDTFWAGYLAVTTTLDVENGDRVSARLTPVADVGELPASGGSEVETAPQGLGWNAIHVDAAAGDKRRALEVTFSGDPEVPWHVVLVRTWDGAVVDYVALEIGSDGQGTGWLSGFDGVDGWIVVSPHAADVTPRDYTWDADLVRDPGPMDGTVTLGAAPEVKGCSVVPGGTSAAPVVLAALAILALRRRPFGTVCAA